MPGMPGMSLLLVGVGDAGDVAGKILPFFGVFLEAGFVSARLVVAFGGLPRDSKGKTKQAKASENKGKQRKARDSKRKHVMLLEALGVSVRSCGGGGVGGG